MAVRSRSDVCALERNTRNNLVTGRPVIIDALRTPIGRQGGALRDMTAPLLAASVVRALIDAVIRARPFNWLTAP